MKGPKSIRQGHSFLGVSVAVGLLLLAAASFAAEAIVSVPGTTGPWDVNINPLFKYGTFAGGEDDRYTSPISVSKANGIAFRQGDHITITYIDGTVYAHQDLPGDGANGVASWHQHCGSDFRDPGCYTFADGVLIQLVGTFARESGEIVDYPFMLGNGPNSARIPVGATQLLLGFNDSWSNDNSGSIRISVIEECTPAEEQTKWGGWWSNHPSNTTIGDWKQTLFPTDINFEGAKIRETGGKGHDSCHWPGSILSPFDQITDGPNDYWIVQKDNEWFYDHVGAQTGWVTYYRTHPAPPLKPRAPCGVRFPQQMKIKCSSKDTYHNYGQLNELGFDITATDVKSIRAGKSQKKVWP